MFSCGLPILGDLSAVVEAGQLSAVDSNLDLVRTFLSPGPQL